VNGPLLIELLPPERLWDSTAADPDSAPVIGFLLLAGILLTLLLHDKER
jgi:hypothetical protein